MWWCHCQACGPYAGKIASPCCMAIRLLCAVSDWAAMVGMMMMMIWNHMMNYDDEMLWSCCMESTHQMKMVMHLKSNWWAQQAPWLVALALCMKSVGHSDLTLVRQVVPNKRGSRTMLRAHFRDPFPSAGLHNSCCHIRSAMLCSWGHYAHRQSGPPPFCMLTGLGNRKSFSSHALCGAGNLRQWSTETAGCLSFFKMGGWVGWQGRIPCMKLYDPSADMGSWYWRLHGWGAFEGHFLTQFCPIACPGFLEFSFDAFLWMLGFCFLGPFLELKKGGIWKGKGGLQTEWGPYCY